MTKRKTKREFQKLFDNLSEMIWDKNNLELPNYLDTTRLVDKQNATGAAFAATVEDAQESGEIPRMKKFRFQLLSQWLMNTIQPCRAGDIGGGKGLLAYLLRKNGWNAQVIDPVDQPLPEKYKDLGTNKRVKILPGEKVPRMTMKFEPGMARHFDLLVGMHAHACNVKIIDAAAEHKCGFVLLPCCIIDEPIIPPPGVHWLECLASYAIEQGFVLRPFRLNFRGQNIGFYSVNIKNNPG